ncbi:MAG TPA: 50S ribosomal protein L22 [bacterium]|nr:50S ribosomal protein L22 [bacterium]
MGATAKAKYVRISAKKARLVADMVRGRPLEEAKIALRFTDKKAARIFLKVLESAQANVETSTSLDIDQLVVKTVTVDEGFRLKRFRPCPQGRASRILKRTSHITVVLAEG